MPTFCQLVCQLFANCWPTFCQLLTTFANCCQLVQTCVNFCNCLPTFDIMWLAACSDSSLHKCTATVRFVSVLLFLFALFFALFSVHVCTAMFASVVTLCSDCSLRCITLCSDCSLRARAAILRFLLPACNEQTLYMLAKARYHTGICMQPS